MSFPIAIGVSVSLFVVVVVIGWLNLRLRNQNRLIRRRLERLEGEVEESKHSVISNDQRPKSLPEGDDDKTRKVDADGDSLAKSRIARNGLNQGTPAPNFRLPGLDGADVRLDQYRNRKVLLVFSDPKCGPCNLLAPQLETLARRTPDIQVLMVSRGDLEVNRLKAAEHGLTFPVLLQKHWEVSRLYAMFATPIAYLIDEQGIISANVAAGPGPILNLLISGAILSLLGAEIVAGDETIEIQESEEGVAMVAT